MHENHKSKFSHLKHKAKQPKKKITKPVVKPVVSIPKPVDKPVVSTPKPNSKESLELLKDGNQKIFSAKHKSIAVLLSTVFKKDDVVNVKVINKTKFLPNKPLKTKLNEIIKRAVEKNKELYKNLGYSTSGLSMPNHIHWIMRWISNTDREKNGRRLKDNYNLDMNSIFQQVIPKPTQKPKPTKHKPKALPPPPSQLTKEGQQLLKEWLALLKRNEMLLDLKVAKLGRGTNLTKYKVLKMGLYSFFKLYHDYPKYMYVKDEDLYKHKIKGHGTLIEWYSEHYKLK